jgi:hypothetical protein
VADLTAIRNALAAQITAVAGLRAYGQAKDSVSPPAAVIIPGRPFMKYGVTMPPIRAADMRLVVLVVVSDSAPTDQTQQDLDAYLGIGTGEPGSIALALQADPTLGGLVSDSYVDQISTYGRIDYAAVTYFGARLDVVLDVT